MENPIPRIIQRKKALLQAAGYPADYLEPIYSCPACKDTGYVLLGSGLREKCQCFKKQELTYLYEQSNLQGILHTDRFENVSYGYCQGEDQERLRGAVRISKEFAETFPCGKNLLFYGTVGPPAYILHPVSSVHLQSLFHSYANSARFCSEELYSSHYYLKPITVPPVPTTAL